jgi:hypothetical protein
MLRPVSAGLMEDLDDEEVIEADSLRTEVDKYTPETFDGYLTASVMLPQGGEVLKANVVARKRDAHDIPVGKATFNPILDTQEYVVEFMDGAQDVYAANLISKTMYVQLDNEGRRYLLLLEIIDHEANGRAMKVADGMFTDTKGRLKPRITTQGWRQLVK